MRGKTDGTKGHKAGRDGCYCVYSVYDKKTTLPVIVDGTSAECARAMGMSLISFYSTLSRLRTGKSKGTKWEIWARYLDRKGEVCLG